ncbi:hypothetical protein EBR21_13125 [bacterium]|nr:hypothetical protein [bacterium]
MQVKSNALLFTSLFATTTFPCFAFSNTESCSSRLTSKFSTAIHCETQRSDSNNDHQQQTKDVLHYFIKKMLTR